MQTFPNNFIINLVPIASGGGLQNGESFIETIARSSIVKSNLLVFVRSNSEIEKSCIRYNLNFLSFRSNFRGRIKFDFFSNNLFSSYSVCFTLFGPPPISSFGSVTNITGCAYSNLFYPELPFWSYLPFHQRYLKEAIDIARRRYVKTADFWIFETEALRKRAIELCNFPEERVAVVRMAPSKLISKDQIKPGKLESLKTLLPSSYKILYLSGAHPNKRLHLLPAIAEELVKLGHSDFTFVTTIDKSSSYAKAVLQAFNDKNITAHIYNIGPIPPGDVATVIESCDAMCTLSLLESFSNNFIEAWQMEKPLVVTDADWSKDSCGAAALYVNPVDAGSSAAAISRLITDCAINDRLVAAGRNQLLSYNIPETKLAQYLELIERASNLGPLSRERRKQIRWP